LWLSDGGLGKQVSFAPYLLLDGLSGAVYYRELM
jgi:hypothetical protein